MMKNYIYSNENFTDGGLSNFGKSLENLLALNSIYLSFYAYFNYLIIYYSKLNSFKYWSDKSILYLF